MMKLEDKTMARKIRLAALSLAMSGMLATSAIASEVTIPNTFSAGSPAVASEVNANFSAVKTAVDDNNRRADELEALANKLDSDMTAALTEVNNRLSALESQLAQMVGGSGAALTQASLTGVYKFIYMDVEMIGNLDNYSEQGASIGKGDITFDGAGGFTVVDTSDKHVSQGVRAGTDPLNSGIMFTTTQTVDSTLESTSGTYTVSPDGKVTLTFADDGSQLDIHMAPGLIMGTGGMAETETLNGGGDRTAGSLVVVVKKSN
jgi:hypothetical protein